MADVKVAHTLSCLNPDTPTTRDSENLGGYRALATTTLRDAIPAAMRVEGMRVHVAATGLDYVLQADLTTWSTVLSEVPAASGNDGYALIEVDGVADWRPISIYAPRPTQPTTILFRQYYNVVERALDQEIDADPTAWKALFPNVGFEVLIQIPGDAASVAAAGVVLARLEAHGIDAFPGFRLNPSGGSDAWFDAGYWDAHASAFAAVWAVRANDDHRFGFDIEVYGSPDQGQPTPAVLALYGRTPAQLATAMAPFLAALDVASAELVAGGFSPLLPCIHPTVRDPSTGEPDQVMDIITEHFGGVAELWSEESFGNVETTRRLGEEGGASARLGTFADMDQLRSLYPKASTRYGLDESLIRRWGGPVANDADSDTAQLLNAPGCFLFDTTRRDNTVFMTTDWYNGYPTLNALNDVAVVFEAGELNLNQLTAYPSSGTVLTGPAVLDGWVNDSLNNSAQAGWYGTRKGITFPGTPGTLTSDTIGLRESVVTIPIAGTPTWTLDMQFYLPFGSLGDRFPIASCVQYNAKGWILAYNTTLDRIELVVKTGSFTETVLEVLAAPSRDVLTRVQVGRNGTEWRHGTSRTAGVGNGEACGFLMVGLGWSSMDSGTGVRTSAAGLTWSGPLHIWHRFLSDANIAALTADGGRYPWGYGN